MFERILESDVGWFLVRTVLSTFIAVGLLFALIIWGATNHHQLASRGLVAFWVFVGLAVFCALLWVWMSTRRTWYEVYPALEKLAIATAVVAVGAFLVAWREWLALNYDMEHSTAVKAGFVGLAGGVLMLVIALENLFGYVYVEKIYESGRGARFFRLVLLMSAAGIASHAVLNLWPPEGLTLVQTSLATTVLYLGLVGFFGLAYWVIRRAAGPKEPTAT